ncbi:MAG: HAMP domain-containing histidine kinase, partial [Bacteroidales bacterium]|nr:HAMP domain-containing histidine kinase [Bacteroidales bacterium]
LAAIGQVSSFIAHELKNPLSAAGNALFLLEKKTHMLPELQKYIHIARDELQSCFAVINSVLQLNRVRDPVMSQFDLALLLNNILERYFKHLPVELSYEFNPDPFFIQADQEQFNMVFQNLIKNSIESNPSGVRITVKGWVEEGKYKVLFCDDGVGIPEEYHSHIFDPLFTSKGFGTGLGLTLCKAILQRHDGDIRLLPQVKGCCFELVWTVKKIKI